MSFRTRTRGALQSNVSSGLEYFRNASDRPFTESATPTGKFEQMSDLVTPQFSRKRSLGEIVNSPMEKSTLTVTRTPKPTRTDWIKVSGSPINGENTGASREDCFGAWNGSYYPTVENGKIPKFNDSRSDVALTRARAGVAAPEAQLLVSLGEARETFNLLSDAMGLLLRRTMPFQALQRKYYRGELSYAAFSREMASLWLLYRYGIMPLYYDIKGYMEALTKPGKPDRRTSRTSDTYTDSGTWQVWHGGNDVTTRFTEWQWTSVATYRATVLYEAEDTIRARLGLRLGDIPMAAWELRRLSFVWDWFINIGDFISSLVAESRASVKMQCVVETLVWQGVGTIYESGDGKMQGTIWKSKLTTDGSGAKVNVVYTRKTRKPYNSLYVGSLSPVVKLNWQRLVDGFSLLANNLDTRSKSTRRVRI